MYSGNRKRIGAVVLGGIVAFFAIAWAGFAAADRAAVLGTFEECVAAGNPVMESYPRRCTSMNKTFTEDIGNAIVMADQIRVAVPRPNQGVAFPLTIEGEAREEWFGEGIFSVRLVDDFGRTIATTDVVAGTKPLLGSFVPFTAQFAQEPLEVPERAVLIFTSAQQGTTDVPIELAVPIRIVGDISNEEPESSTRAFTRSITLREGDLIQFGDGMFVRLGHIAQRRCVRQERCVASDEELVADLELSGGELGASITDVRLGEARDSSVTLLSYTLTLLEVTSDEVTLQVPADLPAVALHYQFATAE